MRLREPTLLTTVQVAIGSEDANFFQDQQVQADLANDGYTVVPIQMGSRQMAQNVLSLSHNGYDAIFPSSDDFAQEAVDELPRQLGDLPVFRTPLAVFRWRDLIPQLQADGIVDHSGTTFNVGQYLAAADADATWTVTGKQESLLLDMTDPAKSNSGAMFLGVASTILNHGNQVQSTSAAAAIARTSIGPILDRVGSFNNTTAHLFESYLDDGESAEPLVLGYESEFLEVQRAGQLPAGAVRLQMSPSVICVHTLVPLDGAGVKFGARFYADKALLKIAAQKYGFDSPDQRETFVNAPSYQIIEAMISVVG